MYVYTYTYSLNYSKSMMPTYTCTRCKIELPIDQFYRNSKAINGRLPHCKKCQNKSMNQYHDDPRRRMHQSSYINARAKGITHTISYQDIPLPEICKYLGIKIDYRRAEERGRLRSFDAPSIDRIDPTKGYIPENIQVISDLANRMKQDATIEQLLAFAEGVIRVHGIS